MDIQNKISINKWNIIHSGVLLIATGISVFLGNTNLLAVATLLSFLGLMITQLNFLSTLKPFGGYANWVTATRLILLLSGMVFYPLWSGFELFAVLLIAVLLDIFDGWLARKFNHESHLGMYFDMETDALYVLFVCIYLYLQGWAGAWILIPGLLRYIYKLFTFMLPKPGFEEQKQRYAAIIAGSYFVILLLSVGWQNQFQYFALVIGSLGIIGSFGKSFWDYLNYGNTTHQQG